MIPNRPKNNCHNLRLKLNKIFSEFVTIYCLQSNRGENYQDRSFPVMWAEMLAEHDLIICKWQKKLQSFVNTNIYGNMKLKKIRIYIRK